MTDFDLAPSVVVARNVAGFGAQFNQHVYARLTGAPTESFADLEAKVAALRPQFVRLFYNDRQETSARDQFLSFVLAVELAQRVDATINITWQSGGVDDPEGSMGRFASVLTYLAIDRGIGNLRWVTVQNEPNSTNITPAQNEAMYRALDRHLQVANVRSQIRFMGGDLVETNQEAWFEYMATHLADLLDAYPVHVYWRYDDLEKLQRRLVDVRTLVNALPQSGQKPLYVTEYGVRGDRAKGHPDPGVYSDGTPIAQTAIAAFQHAWFQILAAQLGFVGASKWDCFYGKYDRGAQAYYTIGPFQQGWPLYPTYRLLRLFTTTIGPGWSVIQLEQRAPTAAGKVAAALTGPSGELTIVGLHTDGAHLNKPSSTQVPYTIGGLLPGARFALHLWNRDGRARNEISSRPAASNDGVVTFKVPLHSVFALTATKRS